jgi:hypothetical protein
VAKTSSPASASQPSLGPGQPASPKLDAGDDRLQSAVWRAGRLWTGGNDACRFRTDTRSRSCLRVIEVLTSGMTVARDVDITFVGGDLMYPAVMLDRVNDFWVGYSSVSTSQFASSEVAEALGGAIGASIGATIYGSGTGVVDYSGCTSPPAIRFGDYSGAAIDPQERDSVWTAEEFGIAGCSWGTQVARFTP